MTDDQKTAVKTSLNTIRNTWHDVPKHVNSDEYEVALAEWIEQCVTAGRKDIETLVVHALDHEYPGKMPYFEFNRTKRKARKTS
jgi:poly(3-hydroxybutyrate) depolymerase